LLDWLKAYDKGGKDITDKLFAPNGFMKVDADYTAKPYEEWKASDWPRTYQNPDYGNIFAAGIAFAPPHLISKPMKSKNGTPINPHHQEQECLLELLERLWRNLSVIELKIQMQTS